MEQAEICCDQARSAALKKRFTAALGLFRTAQNLYNRVIALGGDACNEARERLQSLTVEIAAYAELARPRQPLPRQPLPRQPLPRQTLLRQTLPKRVPVKVIARSHDELSY